MKQLKNLLLALIAISSSLHAEIQERCPVVILGGGIGSLTAATYFAQAGAEPTVIEGKRPGGAIASSHSVRNWPGELDITGWELSEKIRKQAEASGSQIISEEVIGVDFSKRPFVITTRSITSPDQVKKIVADVCVIGTGSTPNHLGVPGELEFENKGVFHCAVCDGPLYKNKDVVVIGGGDSALTAAEYLSNIAKKVHLLVRGDSIRSSEVKRKEEVLSRKNIEVHYKTTVKAFTGEEGRLSQIHLMEGSLAVEAAFIAIGTRPNSALFAGQLQLDERGYIVLKNGQETSVPAVFAIGDVVDPIYQQAVSAAADGAKAAIQAQPYLTQAKKPVCREPIEITSLPQFDKEIVSSGELILIDFYAPWCGPCRSFGPIFTTWAKEYGDKVKCLKVNVSNNNEIADRYGIRSIPTLIILDANGKVIRTSVGLDQICQVESFISSI